MHACSVNPQVVQSVHTINRMGSPTGVASISILDDIAIHQIFRNLPAHYLAQASCVCRGWNSIAADEALWEDAYRQLEKPAYIANAAQQLDEIAAGTLQYTRKISSHNLHIKSFHTPPSPLLFPPLPRSFTSPFCRPTHIRTCSQAGLFYDKI